MDPLSGPASLGASPLKGGLASAIPAVLGLSPSVAAAVIIGVGLAAGVGIAAWYRWVLGARGESTLASRSRFDSTSVEESEPAAEPASDEDRVVSLLRDHGGRMKQTRIVEQTDWSKSKVSMLLSEMEEQGLVTKLRVGRENLVSLPGEEPEAVGTSFDEE